MIYSQFLSLKNWCCICCFCCISGRFHDFTYETTVSKLAIKRCSSHFFIKVELE